MENICICLKDGWTYPPDWKNFGPSFSSNCVLTGKITYVKMTPEKAARVIEEHLKNGNVVNEYTIAAHK